MDSKTINLFHHLCKELKSAENTLNPYQFRALLGDFEAKIREEIQSIDDMIKLIEEDDDKL